MGVKFYISENSERRDKGFKHPPERENMVQIARLMWRCYREATLLYALLFNIDKPPADIIIITNDGIGVADLKNISGSLSGDAKSTWTTTSPTNAVTRVNAGTFKNPYLQVEKYREVIKAEMQRMGGVIQNKPKWLLNGDFEAQAAVVITGGSYNTEKLDDRIMRKSWFAVREPSNICDWAYSLSYKGSGHDPHQLSESQVETLARVGFRTKEWDDMENMLTNNEPYGVLVHRESDDEKTKRRVRQRHNLVERRISIGRGGTTHIRPEFVSTSSNHATIECKIAGVFIRDEGSKHGTWVNGKKITEETVIKFGDKLVFGPCDESTGASSVDGSYYLYEMFKEEDMTKTM